MVSAMQRNRDELAYNELAWVPGASPCRNGARWSYLEKQNSTADWAEEQAFFGLRNPRVREKSV